MKLARNMLTFVSYAAAAEAGLAEACGLDLVALGKVVRHSDSFTGGAGAIMFRNTTAPMEPADPLRPLLEHTRGLGEKDLSLALALGEVVSVDLPLAQLALQRLAAGLGYRTRTPSQQRRHDGRAAPHRPGQNERGLRLGHARHAR